MALPEFDGFSLQDDNFITSTLEYRTIPQRSIHTGKLTRRPGIKLIGHEFAQRTVSMSGSIVADSIAELQSLIDGLHTNVTRKDEGILQIESGRTATATVTSVVIGDPHYAQDYVPFEIEFLMADPFFYGDPQTVTTSVVSGTSSSNLQITISGSVFAEPTITFASTGSSGSTTTSGIQITYGPTAEQITWSGTNGSSVLSYGSTVSFDYVTQRILQNTVAVDIEGVFARWEPGLTSYTVTFSGRTQGGTLAFSYQPRYL